MLLAFSVGCSVFGALSDRMGRRKPAYLGGAIGVAIGWLSMFYLNVPQSTFTVLAALTGFFTGSFIIGFAYGRESAPGRFMGTVTAVTNMGNMLGVVLLQPGIGWMLDRHWDGTLVNGAHVYALAAWRTGFILLAGWSVLSVALIAMTRETSGKAVTE